MGKGCRAENLSGHSWGQGKGKLKTGNDLKNFLEEPND